MTVRYRDHRVKVGSQIPNNEPIYLTVKYENVDSLPFTVEGFYIKTGDNLSEVGEVKLDLETVTELYYHLEEWLLRARAHADFQRRVQTK